jgi:hypothetical protein
MTKKRQQNKEKFPHQTLMPFDLYQTKTNPNCYGNDEATQQPLRFEQQIDQFTKQDNPSCYRNRTDGDGYEARARDSRSAEILNCSSAAMLAALATACAWASTLASHRTTPDRRLPPAAGTLAQPRGFAAATAPNAAAAAVADAVLAIV